MRLLRLGETATEPLCIERVYMNERQNGPL